MKDYLIKFNEDGRRGTTYAEGVHYYVDKDGTVTDGSVKVQDLLADGFVFVDTADYLNLLGNNDDKQEYCRQADGTFSPYIAPEPTAEEKAASKQASLDAEYTAAQQKLGQSLLVANLNGDADIAASIQGEFADLNTYYKEQSDAITAELTAATEGSDK
jgi:hypothetical protein